MKVAIYVMCYNEAVMLPFFVQHYRNVADKIVIYDNMSTDNSRDIALSLGIADIRELDTGNQINDAITLQLRNEAWKESRDYDWVMWVDMDEIVYHPYLRYYLEDMQAKRFTVCVPQGYQMVGNTLPSADKPITEQIKLGIPNHNYSKPIIFSPKDIEDTNFYPGAHAMKPTGLVKVNTDQELKLLHYHWLSLDWVLERNKWRSARLSAINKIKGWGREYLNEENKTRREHSILVARSNDVFKDNQFNRQRENFRKSLVIR